MLIAVNSVHLKLVLKELILVYTPSRMMYLKKDEQNEFLLIKLLEICVENWMKEIKIFYFKLSSTPIFEVSIDFWPNKFRNVINFPT